MTPLAGAACWSWGFAGVIPARPGGPSGRHARPIIDGENDSRRSPGDDLRLAEQAISAGATVTQRVPVQMVAVIAKAARRSRDRIVYRTPAEMAGIAGNYQPKRRQGGSEQRRSVSILNVD